MPSIQLIGDTLVIPNNDGLILYGLSTRKLVRVSEPHLTDDVRQQWTGNGLFRTVTHTPTCDVRKVWRGFSSLMLLVARRCNLRCIYCYADAQPNGALMTEDLALQATSYYLRQLPDAVPCHISFHGGGEPTLNMPVMRSVVNTVRANKTQRKTTFSVVSNGTFDRYIADWLVDERFSVSISWDGVPEVQNRNRPFVGGKRSSEHLERTARHFAERGHRFTVRTTVSPRDDVRATIRYFAEQGVRSLHLEPLFPNGREYQQVSFGQQSNHETYAPTGEQLAALFMEALDECEKQGVSLRSVAIDKGLPPWHGSTFCGHACGRGMVVTHDGSLTACSEVVDGDDAGASVYHFGRWDAYQKQFSIDEGHLTRLLKRHVNNIPECRDCFARYACGGGCAIKAFRRGGDAYSVEPENCAFVRAIVPELVRRSAAMQKV